MPINPCGAVCDFGRRPYRTRCRFSADSGVEAGIRWYIADHDARPLPFPSAILNSDWEDNELEADYGFDPRNIGEVRGADRRADFSPGPQRATGAHQCGEPAWYVHGVPADPSRRPVRYNLDGLPVCCAPGRGVLLGSVPLGARGGVLLGSAGAEVHGADDCFGSPVLAPDTLYTQPPALMGPVGNGLWFDLGFALAGSPVLTVADLGGANAVAQVLWRTGSSCFSASTVGGAITPPFVVDTSGWVGFRTWAVVIPATTGAGVMSPTFTIQQTS